IARRPSSPSSTPPERRWSIRPTSAGSKLFTIRMGSRLTGGGTPMSWDWAARQTFPQQPAPFNPTSPGPGTAGDSFGGTASVLKLNPTGTGLVYSTFLGGLGPDQANDIAVDADGAAYVTGDTGSSNFPVSPDAPQRSISGFSGSGFVTKLNAQGSDLVWSTFV